MWLTLALTAVAAPPAGFDPARAEAEAVRILADYVRADTRNPPGNEAVGVSVLTDVLDAEGIGWETREIAPGRPNLIARLPGGDGPALCLHHHADVAEIEPSRWTHGPLSGEIAPDAAGRVSVWGRGALDMKSTGVAHLLTLVWLHRLRVPLDRDVVLLVTADEEVHNAGIAAWARDWADVGCGTVIGEGGIGLQDALFDGQTVYPITVAEKGAVWLRLTATGAPGHGSVPDPASAPWRLVRALERLERHRPKVRVHPAVGELIAAAGRERGGAVRIVTGSRALRRALVIPQLRAAGLGGLVTDTINVTGFGGEQQPNVVPSEVYAVLDCRVLPGTTSDALLQRITRIVDDPAVRLDVITRGEAPVSEWRGDPVFAALADAMVGGRDGVVAGPMISVASSDSAIVRELGVTAYGIGPFEIDRDALRSMHGDDEHLPVAELGAGVARMFGAVSAIVASAAPDR